jgi:hypothetical protein
MVTGKRLQLIQSRAYFGKATQRKLEMWIAMLVFESMTSVLNVT